MDKINYQNGKIYKIWSQATEDFYIGSTTQPLHKRLCQHRGNCNGTLHFNMKIYEAMRKYCKNNFFIELVETFPCNTKLELTKREGELIRELKPPLNLRVECRTYKEYLEDTRDYQRMRSKQYREDNKEALKEKQKLHYNENKDYILQRNLKYNEDNKSKIAEHQKQYYEENKDLILAKLKVYYDSHRDVKLEKAKEYREKNNDKISKYREENKEVLRERFTCDICGGKYTHAHKSEHFRSKKHLNAVNKDG